MPKTDPEIKAMGDIYKKLAVFDKETRMRMITWLVATDYQIDKLPSPPQVSQEGE